MIVYSYHDVLSQPKRIHSVPWAPGEPNVPLYKPAPWVAIVYFVVAELATILLAHTFIGDVLRDQLKPAVYYTVLPGLAVWAMLSLSLDGRPPHLWLLSYMQFLIRPKRTVCGRRVRAAGARVTYAGRVRTCWDVTAPRLHHGWVRGGRVTTVVPVRFTFALRHRKRVMVGSDGHLPTIGHEVGDRLEVRP